MRAARPTTRRLLLALALAAFAAAATSVFLRMHYRPGPPCPELPLVRNFIADELERTGVLKFRSQSCQDRWVAVEVYPGLRDGYFVDLGSADGVLHSNSKMLEDLGWKGVCIDPFPRNMAGRRCAVFTSPVDGTGGRRVRFRMAADLGGIEAHLGRWKGSALAAQTIELETRTLTEILGEAKAPPFIHYLSIDIEGAELEALKGLDFSRYRVGALTIEHNFEEPKRSEIRKLLERHGYRYVRSIEQDDFYLGPK